MVNMAESCFCSDKPFPYPNYSTTAGSGTDYKSILYIDLFKLLICLSIHYCNEKSMNTMAVVVTTIFDDSSIHSPMGTISQ